MTKPDPIKAAVQELEDILNTVPRVGLTNLAPAASNRQDDAERADK